MSATVLHVVAYADGLMFTIPATITRK